MTRKKVWAAWLKFADKLGTIQMMIILTVIYWTFVSVMAIPFKLFGGILFRTLLINFILRIFIIFSD